MSVEGEQHDGGAKAVQRGVGIEQLLPILIVLANMGRHPYAAPQRADAQAWEQVFDRRGGQQRKADGPGPELQRRNGKAALQNTVDAMGANEVEARVSKRDQVTPGVGIIDVANGLDRIA